MRLRHAFAFAVLLAALIPAPGVSASQSTEARSPDTYVVQPDDTLYGISRQTGVPVDVLIRLNRLSDADTIFVGTVLRLREPSSTTTSANQSASVGPATRISLSVSHPMAPSVAAASVPSSTTQAQMQAAGPGPGLYGAAIPLTVGRSLGATSSPSMSATSPSAATTAAADAVLGSIPRSAESAALIPPGTLPVTAQLAMQYIGTPYEYGGSTPGGFDCSGFVYFVQSRAGRPVPRDIAGQYNAGAHPQTLEPGDLVFFQNTYEWGLSHVGIYLGSGQFIHALDEARGVVISSLYEPFYSNHWYGATRLP